MKDLLEILKIILIAPFAFFILIIWITGVAATVDGIITPERNMDVYTHLVIALGTSILTIKMWEIIKE